MDRKKYYVNLASHEISQMKYQDNAIFVIYATDEEVRMLRDKMDTIDEASLGTFWRSHVPIVPYHRNESNDEYDRNLTDAFQMVYDLGDEQTKEHIITMGILDERPL